MIANFMGQSVAKSRKRSSWVARQFGSFLSGLRGGGGAQTQTVEETTVAATAGEGASQGLPTAADDGTITMTFRQVSLRESRQETFLMKTRRSTKMVLVPWMPRSMPHPEALIRTPSKPQESHRMFPGSVLVCFQHQIAKMAVPNSRIGGLSLSTNTDFQMQVQMPAGMTCEGTVADVNNVCIVRVRNGAAAGPFGGSAAFTQSAAARKRAIEYKRKRATEFTA